MSAARQASGLDAATVFDLNGEIALVTGGSSGLGRRFAWVLAANGARVVVTGRRADALNETVTQIRAEGGEAAAVPFDLSADAHPAPVFEAVEAAFGPVSVLVNNAGIPGPGTIAETSLAHWREVLTVNLDAQFLMAQEAARRMAGTGGTIINIASILGLAAARGDAAYAVAKAGLAQLSAVMALECAASGVRVNTIAPGYVVTGMNAEFFASAASRVLTARIPLGRVGQVDDLDGTILLLASPASRFMTGAVIAVDGGHLLNL